MLVLVRDAMISSYSLYGYEPNRTLNLTALIVFAAAWAGHLVHAILYKQRWFGGCMFVACGLETAGYVARWLGTDDPTNMTLFIVQYVCLTLAPAFIMAAVYVLLGEAVVIWGYEYSYFQPWTYSRLFISLDLGAIVLQGCGGALAAASGHPDRRSTGVNIMVAGLVFQVFSTVIFVALCVLFWRRMRADCPFAHTIEQSWAKERTRLLAERNPRACSSDSLPGGLSSDESDESVKVDLISPEYAALQSRLADVRNSATTRATLTATALAVVSVFVRSIYRVAELTRGWTSYLMTHEAFFLSLDALMIAIAVWLLLLLYPGRALGPIRISEVHRAAVAAYIV
ncbi:RTA1 like protein-domain-containing protein [Dipodascopsis tothii]|uniref:RTA1 like protein-domain-containing protein n=1 Tax=Dipodascopsis tothii TaxID=44089 RepID=UPI0034CDD975